METDEILRLLGLEERVDFSEKFEILILAKNRVVKSWRVRLCASHSRVRDPLGFRRLINYTNNLLAQFPTQRASLSSPRIQNKSLPPGTSVFLVSSTHF